jgi:tRNA threonylcarbamoyladenosine biosynthesis protein TsaE
VRIESSSPEETERLAGRLARALEPGDVVTLAGDLGAGKTTFVRGACRALGVSEPVTSPTYTIGHRYTGRDVTISHLDLYRLGAVEEADWGAIEPYLDGALCFVEWPEAAEDWLPTPRLEVVLRHVDSAHRLIELRGMEKSLLATVSEGC